MGVSTNGQICYGITFDAGYEFPWDLDDYQGDIEEWWLCKIHGYKPSFEIYDAKGNYINGKTPPEEEINRYFAEKHEFAKTRPLPVELINYCSGDYPMYALAVPGTVVTALRGDPTEFEPAALMVDAEKLAALMRFCAAHGLEGEPRWLLTSYWS